MPKTALQCMLGKATQFNEWNDLTKTERLAESNFIRAKLERNLNRMDYKTLQLFYRQTSDLNFVIADIRPLAIVLIDEARLAKTQCNPKFACICCVSHALGESLFRDPKYGPVTRYCINAMAASRKKKKLLAVLDTRRKNAMKLAEKILID